MSVNEIVVMWAVNGNMLHVFGTLQVIESYMYASIDVSGNCVSVSELCPPIMHVVCMRPMNKITHEKAGQSEN